MEFKSNKPIFIQIAEYVYGQILLKKWKAAERIPSVREMAASFEVNPNTVARTYELLQHQEIIGNKRGIGFFVNPDALGKIKKIRKQEFLQRELPELFKNIYLLDLNMDEITQEYQTYILNHFKAPDHENK